MHYCKAYARRDCFANLLALGSLENYATTYIHMYNIIDVFSLAQIEAQIQPQFAVTPSWGFLTRGANARSTPPIPGHLKLRLCASGTNLRSIWASKEAQIETHINLGIPKLICAQIIIMAMTPCTKKFKNTTKYIK